MARNKSLWSELQRERDRRARIALAREREKRQVVEQLIQDRERAQRLALRADAAERKRQEQQVHEAGMHAARTLKSQLDRQINELQTLLTTWLDQPPLLTFALLRQVRGMPPFEPGYLADESPVPRWEDYAPRAPGALSGLLGGKGRYARASEAASEAFQRALAYHEQSEAERRRQLQEIQARYDRLVHESEIAAREQNAAVDELERDFWAGAPEAVEEFFGQALALSEYPESFPRDFRVAYRPAPRELVIEYRLPPVAVIPVVRDYRYVKVRGEIDELPRPMKEIKDLYASVIHQVALRTMWECFCLNAADVVDSVVFNGIVSAVNRATGHVEELHLISAPANRADFAKLELHELDPGECLKYLKAILSRHPYDLEAVEPVIEFQKAKYRFADPVDALAGIDSRPDLLKMDWYRFENLIRQLFEAMGLEVSVTQSSRDEGIDAVAYNKSDIVRRAEILIQAKRYSKCVPANDVRALAGSVEEKRATSGILVTTAWVGPESKAFAARNNRLRIIEGGELKHLLEEYLHIDVRIDLARRPKRPD
jgi:restriction system protein